MFIPTQCIATPNERYTNNAFGSRGEHHAQENGSGNGSGNGPGGMGLPVADSAEQARAETVRSFALWILAHYTGRPDDRVHVASHGGLKVMSLYRLRFRCTMIPDTLFSITGDQRKSPHMIPTG